MKDKKNAEAVADEKEAMTEEEKKKARKQELIRVLKFVLFSASAGVIQTVTFTLMNEVGHLAYWPSYLTALVLSVLWNFTINRRFTFKSANNVPIAMLLVAAYYAVFTPCSTLWGNALTKIGWNEYIVLFGTMLINMVTEFLFTRFVVYRNSINTNDVAKKEAEKSKDDIGDGKEDITDFVDVTYTEKTEEEEKDNGGNDEKDQQN